MSEDDTQEPAKPGSSAGSPAGSESAEPSGGQKRADGANGAANGSLRDAASAVESVEVHASSKSDDDAKKDEVPLLTPGNALRRLRGGVTAVVGNLLAFLLMSHDKQMRGGVPLGAVFIAVGAWGIMDLLGTFDDPDDRIAKSMTLDALTPSLVRVVAGGLAFAGSLYGGQSGVGPQWLWGVLVTATFLAWTSTVFQLGVTLGPWAKDELGHERSLLKRHGFWVLAIGALLYFPTMGMYSLWDPWETHYGEVAREILARDDWISLWWAQDGWFWSKPVLNFWIQSIAMATLGTHYKSGEMLLDSSGHPTLHPEWVVRAPNVLFTLLGMYVLYKGVAKVFGRRAGLLGALVLATMPDWYFLAHQTMTDMPCVACMTAAMGMLILGAHTDENVLARLYEVKAGKTAWRLSAWHLLFGAVLIVALPQFLYLFSRNITLFLHADKFGFHAHWDEFYSGSTGNCGLPGNEACTHQIPNTLPKSVQGDPEGLLQGLARLFFAFEPILQGLLWSGVLAFVLYLNWGERRLRRLFYIGAWFLAAVATMGKGPEGLLIPGMCAFAWVCTKRRWSELLRLEAVSGLLLACALVLPWFVAMYVRHGPPFTDRLLFHDMFNRAFHHVHDTNEGDDTSIRFYIWQLGYALFPWTALAPMGLLYWLRRGDSADRGKGDVTVFLFMWFIFTFALFTFMGTKFHHYIFPAVPAVAMLIGIALDQMLEGEEPSAPGSRTMYLVGTFAGVLLLVAGIARMFPGSILGAKELHGEATPGSLPLGGFMAAVGLGMVASFITFFRRVGPSGAPRADVDERTKHERLMIGAAAVAGAFALLLVGRDLIIKPDGADQPGAIRLLQLFTYNYRRPWPDSLDFSGVLSAFTIVGAIATVALASWKWRRHAVYVFGAFAVAWAIWGLDAYMMKTAPHWGQHEAIAAYYEHRDGPDELLVAYQMNWKGENFYTGNHVPAFVSTGATFTNWLKGQREKGAKRMFFITEHSRINGLKSEVQAKKYTELNDKSLNNKFVVVQADL